MRVQIRYFAALREQRNLTEESVSTDASTLHQLYEELRALHGFTLMPSQVRFAVGGAYVEADWPIKEGDEVVLIPPVAGG